jgi:hypothetical protein
LKHVTGCSLTNVPVINSYEKRRLPSANKRPALDNADATATDVEGPGAEYSYHVAGYTSLYPFYNFPDKTRLRLSQFIILPPYQNQYVPE